MARKARQRICYVLPLPNSSAGHRLGINGLAVDEHASILYTGGRDGVICSWDLTQERRAATRSATQAQIPAARIRQQVQAHTHWINDVALARSNELLLSASSDITVKVWRPSAEDGQPPHTIGIHSDYVKTLAVPSPTSEWFASGGLDRRISLWDLHGSGRRLTIDVAEDDVGSLSSKEKGSVYALAATENIICSGGPEGTVRIWDTKSGKCITRLVGHTDNVRDVLLSQDGSTILSASSDRTVKVWSTVAGRCLHTLTMHDASVWSLYSNHYDLSVFYSSDKTGLVAKTDLRGMTDFDDGLSVAVCQEHDGVHKIATAGSYVWTATSKSSVSRWLNVDIEDADVDLPETYIISHPRRSTVSEAYNTRAKAAPSTQQATHPTKIPLQHVLRLSNTARFPTLRAVESEQAEVLVNRRISFLEQASVDIKTGQPIRTQPDWTIEGQIGLMKHVMLNDRRHILTVDTSGEVVMWDIIKCVPVQSFGKRDLEEVKNEHSAANTVAHWCTVNTRTGTVSVVLEEHTCFDAELYADELGLDKGIELKEDQRVNLGKWVLRYLFGGVISEEIRRDKRFRDSLLGIEEPQLLQRDGAPLTISIPATRLNGWHQDSDGPLSASTLRADGSAKVPMTPGLAILAASPAPAMPSSQALEDPFFGQATEGAQADREVSARSDNLAEKSDYFSAMKSPSLPLRSPGGAASIKSPTTPGVDVPLSPNPGDSKDVTAKEGLFGKKFKMGVGRSFSGMKRLGRSTTKEDRAPTLEEKDEAESDSRSSRTSDSTTVQDNFFGCVQKIRLGYEESMHAQVQTRQAHENGLPVARKSLELPTAITPSLPAETPVLKPPGSVTILIQEDRPEAGGVADLLETTVGTVEQACTAVERIAPMWLANVLLRNQIPAKEVVKISFVLEPSPDSNLPSIATDTNNRLNANRMLRARKILAYIAERIEVPHAVTQAEDGQERLKPEERLELWCQGQIVPPAMTLATIRAHLWRGGGDVVLFYRLGRHKEVTTAVSRPTDGPVPP